MKDWTGNKKTTFAQLGASNHSDTDREVNDFYSTDPNTLKIFLDALERDNIHLHKQIWECACGNGVLGDVLNKRGYHTMLSDLVDRGCGGGVDFLKTTIKFGGDILTNPPYRYSESFVEHALELIPEGNYVIMLLKIQFLEGQKRRELFNKYPPKYIYVNSARQTCYINGDMSEKMSSASCYCWFMWEKGFKGEPTIRWI